MLSRTRNAVILRTNEVRHASVFVQKDPGQADIPVLRKRYPEVHLYTLEEWLRAEGWHKRAKHIRAPKE